MSYIQLQSELQDVLDYIISEEPLCPTNLFVKFKEVQKGRAYYKTGRITIPLWSLRRSREFAYYYIIHEICHFIDMGINNHNDRFKSIEKYWLAQFGLQPVYMKAYPKQLLSSNGRILWQREQ